MTKKEAIALEALCEKYLEEALKMDVMISMNLLGRLKISFNLDYGNNYIVLDKAFDNASYINFTGDYYELQEYIKDIVNCVKEHAGDFINLIWSYNHRNELTEEVGEK